MNNLSTPKMDMISSAFLTPPDSREKEIHHQEPKPLSITPLRISFTPAAPSNNFIDFISLFYHRFPHIAHTILSQLNPRDLIHCLGVCKKWREILIANKSFMKIIKDYRKQCKEDEENKLQSTYTKLTNAKPLHNLTNVISRSSKPSIDTSLSSNINPLPAESSVLLQKCPGCGGMAERKGSKRASCTSCRYDFCCDCLEKFHSNGCKDLSPKKSNGDNIIGCKKSKKRLRRL
jgi:hypothetical protein